MIEGCVAKARRGVADLVAYVSPTGSDSNSGISITTPFATLDHARQAVETINGNMTGDIVIYLLGGTYPLSKTITFTPRDSGANGHQIFYEAYPGQTPMLSSKGKGVARPSPLKKDYSPLEVKLVTDDAASEESRSRAAVSP